MRLGAISLGQDSETRDVHDYGWSCAHGHSSRDNASGHRVHLTPRQLEVLELLCEGLPNKLICRRLNISAGTVKVHISNILRELGVSSRLQAVVAARRLRLVHARGHGAEDDEEYAPAERRSRIHA